jgi:hypothetical protein
MFECMDEQHLFHTYFAACTDVVFIFRIVQFQFTLKLFPVSFFSLPSMKLVYFCFPLIIICGFHILLKLYSSSYYAYEASRII